MVNGGNVNSTKQVLEKRNNHPYWIYESMQMIPDMLMQCLESNHKSMQLLSKCIGGKLTRFSY